MPKNRHTSGRRAATKNRRPKNRKPSSARPKPARAIAAAEAGRIRLRRKMVAGWLFAAFGFVLIAGGVVMLQGKLPRLAAIMPFSSPAATPVVKVAALARTPAPTVALSPSPDPSPTPQASPSAPGNILPGGGVDLPILMYHQTPADFGAQLDYLRDRGYSFVTMEQVRAALRGERLPSKPVAITFDDGYADQMQAYAELKARNIPAIFYIINGGEASRWCIGAGRRYNDPAQPPEGCGDQYLDWDQVRKLDRSGLIAIGAHTVDHISLAPADKATQEFEISESKRGIESQLGHKIWDLAYPAGSYSPTTVVLAQAAGYKTAVTTDAGAWQPAGSELTLKRLRNAWALP